MVNPDSSLGLFQNTEDKGKGKVVPVFLNRTPRHEGVVGSEVIAPLIL